MLQGKSRTIPNFRCSDSACILGNNTSQVVIRISHLVESGAYEKVVTPIQIQDWKAKGTRDYL